MGTHKRRELFWNGYGAILSKVGGATGEVAGFLTYRAGEDATDGTAEFVAFTKKQHHALSQGSLEPFFEKAASPLSHACAFSKKKKREDELCGARARSLLSTTTREGEGEGGAGCAYLLRARARRLMGKKQKPLEEPESKAWVIAYSEAEAAEALRDITSGEACVYATTTAVRRAGVVCLSFFSSS